MRRRSLFKKRISESKLIFCFVGVSAFLVFMLLFGLIASAVLINLEDPTAECGKAALAVIILCGISGGCFIRGIRGDIGIVGALIPTVILTGIMFAVSLICSGSIGGRGLMNCLCFLLSASFFTVINGKKKHKRHRR